MIEEFCLEHDITEDQFYGKKVIDRSLDLRGVIWLPDGFAVKVLGYLDLDDLLKLPKGFNVCVRGNLWLRKIEYLSKDSLNGSSIINKDLHLRNLKYLPAGFCPKVNGKISLYNLNSKLLKDLLFYPGVKRELAYNLLKNI